MVERVTDKSPRFFCILGEVERNQMLSTIWRRSVCVKTMLNQIMLDMKYYFSVLLSLVLLVSTSVGLISCGDDEDDGKSGSSSSYPREVVSFKYGGLKYQTLEYEDGVEVISDYLEKYYGDIVIPSSVPYGGEMLPVKRIGENAFSYCNGIKSVTIPESVEIIDENAFAYCKGITEIVIPNSVRSIYSGAFKDCANITSIQLGNKLTYIGCEAFMQCDNITSITIPDGVTELSFSIFQYCDNLRYVKLPDGLTTIGSEAFSGCKALATIDIPKSVKKIEFEAFRSCESLYSVVLPEKLVYVESRLFIYCNKLNNVTLGKNVMSVESQVFYQCKNLKTVYCHASNVPTAGYDLFGSVSLSGATLYVPSNSVNKYRTADQWGKFGKILGM